MRFGRRLSTAPCSRSPLAPFLARQGCAVFDGGRSAFAAAGAASEASEKAPRRLAEAQLLGSGAGHWALHDAHLDFLEAGADVISSCSSRASFGSFRASGAFTDGSLPGGNIVRLRVLELISLILKTLRIFSRQVLAVHRAENEPPKVLKNVKKYQTNVL